MEVMDGLWTVASVSPAMIGKHCLQLPCPLWYDTMPENLRPSLSVLSVSPSRCANRLTYLLPRSPAGLRSVFGSVGSKRKRPVERTPTCCVPMMARRAGETTDG